MIETMEKTLASDGGHHRAKDDFTNPDCARKSVLGVPQFSTHWIKHVAWNNPLGQCRAPFGGPLNRTTEYVGI